MNDKIVPNSSFGSRLVHDAQGSILLVLVFMVLASLIYISNDMIIGLVLGTIGIVAVMRYTYLHKYLDKDPNVMRELAETEEVSDESEES
jgi:hypothetical protein